MRRHVSLAQLVVVLVALASWLAPASSTRAETPAGPPYPAPVIGQAVYDTAGLFSPAAIADAEATIDRIEERTGAEVVVYTTLVASVPDPGFG